MVDVEEEDGSAAASSDEDLHLPTPNAPQKTLVRNLAAFWFLGLCNNFAYVIMLSAAKDILEADSHQTGNATHCQEKLISRACSPQSTGAVLLADILPALAIKSVAPFFVHRLPFGVRHLIVVALQAFSYLLVATSNDFTVAIMGVLLASLGSGLGETSYLALASYFPMEVISFWSSGTGGAGVVGASVYALMTDRRLLALTPSTALLILLLVVPTLFAVTFWLLLILPPSVHRVRLNDVRTYLVAPSLSRSSDRLDVDLEDAPKSRWQLIRPLLRFMIPLMIVYIAEYLINQGLLELQLFTCAQSFNMDPESQYRWFQVLYQIGVFISRSSAKLITIPAGLLPLLAVLQILNAAGMTINAIHQRFPHILLAMAIVLYEGLLGGASYVNTYTATHQLVKPAAREFSLSFVAMSDSLGIVVAGLTAIPLHNWICTLPLWKS